MTGLLRLIGRIIAPDVYRAGYDDGYRAAIVKVQRAGGPGR